MKTIYIALLHIFITSTVLATLKQKEIVDDAEPSFTVNTVFSCSVVFIFKAEDANYWWKNDEVKDDTMQLYFKNLIEELNNIFSKPKNTFDDVQIQFYAKSYQQVARDYCKIFEKRTLHPALCSKKDEKIEFLGLRKDLTFTDAIDDDEEDPTCVNIFLTKNKIKINVPKALEAGATGDLTGFTLRPKQISVTNERKSKKDINGLCQNGTGMSNEFMSNLALIHIPDIVDLNNHQSVLVNVIATKIGHLLGAGHDINDNQKGIMSKTHADQRSTDFSEFSKTQIIPIIKRLISTKHENENQFSEGDIEPKKEAGSSQKKRSKKRLDKNCEMFYVFVKTQ